MANSSKKELDNIKHCNGEKIHLWKFQMHALFMGKKLLGIIDGSEVEPTTIGVAQANWKKCDNQVTNLLCQALSKKYMEYVVACDITHVIWDKVCLIQEQDSRESVHALQQKFFKCDMVEGDTIALHISKIEMVIN
jgi:hypothetical protein